MEVIVHTGTSKIGGAVTEIKSKKGTRIILDYGENLDGTEQMKIPGLTSNTQHNVDAVFISHSHGDHIGSVYQILNDIPIYLEQKGMEIYNILCDMQINYEKKVYPKNKNIHYFEFQKPIVVKDIIVIPYIVDHSAYNSAMFLIYVDYQKVLYTGDYRYHGKKWRLFRPMLKRIGQVDLLITEGTNLTRNKDNLDNVTKVLKEKDLISEFKKYTSYDQIFFMTSSSNIDRIVSLYKAFVPTHEFIEDLSMNSVASILENIPNSNTFKTVKTFVTDKQKNRYEPYGRYINHTKNVIDELPFTSKFAVSVKPSMQNYIKQNQDKIHNACLIYSMYDGYIDDDWDSPSTRNFVNYLQNDLHIPFFEIHTSGHGDITAIKLINKYVNPKNVILIHTENREEGLKIASEIFKNKLLKVNDGEAIKFEEK